MLMKPKWQRARILASEHYPEVIGCEIWVAVGIPIVTPAVNSFTGQVTPAEPQARISILPIRGPWASIPMRNLELLARDENDFAEDVPLLPWKQFLAECQSRPADSQTTRVPE
jgi:hypothetical protein